MQITAIESDCQRLVCCDCGNGQPMILNERPIFGRDQFDSLVPGVRNGADKLFRGEFFGNETPPGD